MAIEVSWNKNYSSKQWDSKQSNWGHKSQWNSQKTWSSQPKTTGKWTEAEWAEWNAKQGQRKQHSKAQWSTSTKPKAEDDFALMAWGVVPDAKRQEETAKLLVSDKVEEKKVEVEEATKAVRETSAETSASQGPIHFCIADSDDEDDEAEETPAIKRRGASIFFPAHIESKPSGERSPASTRTCTPEATPTSATSSSPASTPSSTPMSNSPNLSALGKWAAIECESDFSDDEE